MKNGKSHNLKAGPFGVGFLFEDRNTEILFEERYSSWLGGGDSQYTFRVSASEELDPGYSPDIAYSASEGTEHVISPCFRFSVSPSDQTGTLAVSAEEEQAVDSIENAVRVVLQWVTVREGGFIIHAAAAAKDGRCILFPASEGGGKSTISELCSSLGCSILGDDLVMVVPSGQQDSVLIYGTPFRGETAVAVFDKGPALLIETLFIQKGNSLNMTPCSKSEAAGRILSNTPFLTNAPSYMLEAVLRHSSGITASPCSVYSYSLSDSPGEPVLEKLNG